MRPIKTLLLLTLLLPTLLWVLADTPWPQPFGYFAFRTLYIQLSGIVAIAAMSVAVLLALRPKWLEPWLQGLDKMYRLHKWLGLSALAAAVLHWWLAQGTKWMVGWGWLTRPARGPRPPAPDPSTVEGWLNTQRKLAESLGEWAFYAAALLILLALIKRFPYHLFTKTHRWIAVVYLLLAYHAVVLTRFDYWLQPVGWLLGALLAGGSVAALWSLFGRIGAGRKVAGQIESLQYYPGLDVLESRIALQPGWPGPAAGQFAFVTSGRREGGRP